MFTIRKEEVKIGEEVYKIGPLSGEHIQDLFQILEVSDSIKKSKDMTDEEYGQRLFAEMSKQGAMSKLYKLVFVSLKQEYPDIDDKVLSSFVGQNLLRFFNAVLSVNMPKD